MTPSQRIIQNHDRIRALQREREYRSLSGLEAADSTTQIGLL